ncbi:morphogenic membrane protein MmpB [Streptomyces sp. P1-3]
MLWSDPPDEPPEELRQVQERLRRAGAVMAVAVLITLLILSAG